MRVGEHWIRSKKRVVLRRLLSLTANVRPTSTPVGNVAIRMTFLPPNRNNRTPAPHPKPLRAKYTTPSVVTDGAYCWRPDVGTLTRTPVEIRYRKTLQRREHCQYAA